MTIAIVAVVLALTAVACGSGGSKAPAPPVDTGWVDAWQAVPMGVLPNGCGGPGPVAAFPENAASKQTVRFPVKVTVAGANVRLRLSNRFSTRLLSIAHVTIAQHGGGATLVNGSLHDVTFGGLRSIALGGGVEKVSDPLAFAVDPDTPLAVSIAITSGGPLAWHASGPPDAFASAPGSGDLSEDALGSGFTAPIGSYIALAGIEVQAAQPTKAIAVLGDSLSDGGYGNPASLWSDVVAARLRQAGTPRAVVSAGVACNALLRADANSGPKASERFDLDVLARTGLSHVVVFEGGNDIYTGAAAEAVIGALSALAQRAHALGVRVIGGTIPGRPGGSAEHNVQRRAVNEWLRTTNLLDGVIDFEAAVQAPGNPDGLHPDYDLDGVHVNTRGQLAMGSAVDLALFADTLDPPGTGS